MTPLDFRTSPEQYRHWSLSTEGPIAYLTMNVDETAGVFGGYDLKLNSYDIGVDIELYDAVQRLRFEHPEVKAVVLTSGRPGTFCAGANIRMLGGASHDHKVNFCKFTNETRNALEEAGRHSGQRYLCAVNGAAAGGGYELALATDHILLIDDGNAAVSLPEVPLLAVLPGTGGLTRLVDKRGVRRDIADVFCTVEEGVKGQRALEWRLVDEVAARSEYETAVKKRAAELASGSDRPDTEAGVAMTPLKRTISEDRIVYPHLVIGLDRANRAAHLHIEGPADEPPGTPAGAKDLGAAFWPLAVARALDDALLHLRFNEPDLGTLVFHTSGSLERTTAHDAFLHAHSKHWLMREVLLYLKRTFKRMDLTSRSLVALVEPGSCYAGLLAELLFSVDRSYILDGTFEGTNLPAPAIVLSDASFGAFPMGNDLTRLQTRFVGEPHRYAAAKLLRNQALDARATIDAGLITLAPDVLDWEDEIRLFIEERASFSPDALTAMEANLRFAGPETMETRIFGRLSAWQNWVFQRPNAVGRHGALSLYGSGQRPEYDRKRV